MVPKPSDADFSSPLRSPAVTARVGRWLGISFGICFLTGIYSHYAQEPLAWLPLPSAPSWGYRVTQGVHVYTGIAAVPLLLVKLWSVYPKLFEAVPRRPSKAVVGHLLERASITVLVASAIFLLATGLPNSAQWYPWTFDFRDAHFAAAWLAIGALLVHIAIKLPLIRETLGAPVDEPHRPREQEGRVLSRRGLLRTTWVAAGVAVLATVGGSIDVLRKVSVFAVRTGEGPQGVPINHSAVIRGVVDLATDPGWKLTVANGDRSMDFSLDDLRAMPQTTSSIPISCVEGWSASAVWTGVRIRDLMALVGAPTGADMVTTSLQSSGSYAVSVLPSQFVQDDDSLLALDLNGEPLSIDHGQPARLIAPNRPGVLQTKWVKRLEVQA